MSKDDKRAIGHDLCITTVEPGLSGAGSWISGTVNGHEFHAKMYPDHATNQDCEIGHEQLSTIIERTSRYALQLSTEEALKLCEPILASVDDNYQEVSRFVHNLITSEDQMHTGEKFWALWQEIANRLKGASWMKHLDSDYPGYDSLICAVFFGPPCSRERFHWTAKGRQRVHRQSAHRAARRSARKRSAAL